MSRLTRAVFFGKSMCFPTTFRHIELHLISLSIASSDFPCRDGTQRGRQAIEAWFHHFKEAIPTRTFRIISISVSNVFDFVGNNVIAVQWDNRPINKAGREFYVRGVTVSRTRWGKIIESTTSVFDYLVLAELWGEGELKP